jgi:hypothetical protein
MCGVIIVEVLGIARQILSLHFISTVSHFHRRMLHFISLSFLFGYFREDFCCVALILKLMNSTYTNAPFVSGQVIKTTIQNNGGPVNETDKFISLSKKQKDGSWLRTHLIMNSDMPVSEMQTLLKVLFTNPQNW